MKFHLHDHARPLFDDPEITGNMLRRLAIDLRGNHSGEEYAMRS